MRLLFLHQHYYPETVGTSTRLVEIAEFLAKRGHDITVVTGIPSHPSTMNSGEVKRDQPGFEEFRGVKVHRVWTFGSSGRDNFLRRMLAYGTFMVLGCFKALAVRGKFDALIAVSPLPNGIAGFIVSTWRRIPLMFDVCDIWPDCAVAVGMLQNRVLIRMAHYMEKRIYDHSYRVGVVTRGFTENLVGKGVERGKVALLPDWVEPDIYDSSKIDVPAVRAEYNFGDKYVVSFLGNFGLLMGLETILETARIVKEREPNVLFLFVGKGVGLPMMEQKVAEWNLDNVRIMPYQPRSKVPGFLAASDALIVTYMKTSITQFTVPSKIYEYMSSSRPIVAGVDGVIREILTEAQCGLVSPSRDPKELADHILRLKVDPDAASEMGVRGRAYASEHFSFKKVSLDYEAAIMETVLREDPK